MNIGFISCSLLGGLFLLLWLLFTLLGDRAAMLISGFNTLPPEKRLTWSNTMNIHYPPKELKNPSPMAWSQGALESGLVGKLKIRFSKIASAQ